MCLFHSENSDTGSRVTSVTWRCHMPISQWQCSFQLKDALTLVKGLWQHQIAVVMQLPGSCCRFPFQNVSLLTPLPYYRKWIEDSENIEWNLYKVTTELYGLPTKAKDSVIIFKTVSRLRGDRCCKCSLNILNGRDNGKMTTGDASSVKNSIKMMAFRFQCTGAPTLSPYFEMSPHQRECYASCSNNANGKVKYVCT